jgi:putative phosphoesterase
MVYRGDQPQRLSKFKPMRTAALYDIHANLPALEAVLRDVRAAGVDRIVIGGDVVPGPMPKETIACLREVEIPMQCIQGNGDREVVAHRRGIESAAIPEAFRESMRWNAQQLSNEDEQWLSSWPKTLQLDDVLFCHATPRNDVDVFSRLTPEAQLLPLFSNLGVSLVICGHTHMQFDRNIGQVRVVNAGSVGMPFCEPGAYWLLLEPAVQLRRTSYNLDEAAQRIRATSYPQADEFAARNILQPRSEEEMLKAFSQARMRIGETDKRSPNLPAK